MYTFLSKQYLDFHHDANLRLVIIDELKNINI